MDALLFANLSTNSLSGTLKGSAFTWPRVVAGDTLRLRLRLTALADGEVVPASRRVVDSIKASLGRQQQWPEAGTFALKLGAGAEDEGVNTTSALAFNATAAQIAAALDALTDPALADAQPFDVTELDDSFLIAAADRSALEWSVADNELLPASKVHIGTQDFDDGEGAELRLIQAPVAETTAFAAIVPAAPEITQEQAGATASGMKRPEIQRLYVPPDTPAGMAFVLTRGSRRSAPITIGENDSAEAIADLLNTRASDDGTITGFVDEGEVFEVTDTENGVLMAFMGDMNGTDQDLLGVEIVSEPDADIVLALDTKTPAMAWLMRKANATTQEIVVPLDVVLWIEDEQDDAILHKHTFQVKLTFTAPVSMDDLSAAADVNWTTPLSRESYIQHMPDQILTGQRHFIDDSVGDGASDEITISHNLATRYLHVTAQETAADGFFLTQGTDYRVQIVSDNAVKLVFPSGAPSLNSLRVQITTAAHTANYQAHTHTIDEIVDLETRLAALEAAVAALEALVPSGSLGASSASSGAVLAEWRFREFLEAYPPARDLLAVNSATATTSAEAAGTEAAFTLATLPLAMLPADGALLPAVHDHIPGGVAAILASGALPAASSTHEGKVYVNDHSALVTIPGIGGVRGEKLRIGEHVACARVKNVTGSEKFAWFKVARVASTEGTWHATAFERELFLIAVSASQLLEKKSLEVSAEIELAVLSRDLAALAEYQRTAFENTILQWQLVIEWGTKSSVAAATGGTFTSTHASDLINATGHGLSDGQTVKLTTSGTLPAGLSPGTTYCVRDAAANTFKLALTAGGAAINLSDDGTGTHTFTPQTATRNLETVTWNATPLLTETLHLTRDPVAVKFGCKVDRTGASTFAAYKVLHGITSAADSTPTSAEMFLRGRLRCFDTQDGIVHPVGVVCLRLASGSAKVT